MKFKNWIYVRWFLVVFLVGLFGLLTAWIVFPIAYLLKPLKKSLFWIWWDDKRLDRFRPSGYAEDYEIILNEFGLTKENFRSAYYWHVSRNRVWNLKELFYIPFGAETDYEVIIDNLHRDGKIIHDYGNGVQAVEQARLKYWTTNSQGEPVSGWNVNKGWAISKEYSTFGESFVEFSVWRADGERLIEWRSFRYSQCKIVDYKIFGIRIWKGYRTIKIGTNRKRYVDTLKHQNIKPVI